MKKLIVAITMVLAAFAVQAEDKTAEHMICMKDKKVVDLGTEKDAKKLEAACLQVGGIWEASPKKAKKAGGGGW